MPNKNPLVEALNAVYRYRLIAACTFVVCAAVVLSTVHWLPDRYRSTTLIMVESQSLPQSYVKSPLNNRMEKRLQALSQEVLSRTRLERIVEELNLFPRMRARKVPRERVVRRLRDRIDVRVFPRDRTFRISYEGSSPKTVRDVTARLARLYIDENLALRERQVSEATKFLENELTAAKRQLDEQEAGIQRFKQEHAVELPERQEANIRVFEGLQEELQKLTGGLFAAGDRKVLLDRRIAAARIGGRPAGGDEIGTRAIGPPARLAELEAELVGLRAKYKDEHPDVIRLRHVIARLKRETAGAGGARERSESDFSVPAAMAAEAQEVELELTRLQRRRDAVRTELDQYRKRLENTFATERALLKLSRDHGVTLKKYQALLDKKLEAQLSENLEERRKGEHFRVLDAAVLPESPSRPNRFVLVLAGLAAAVALALVVPVVLWRLDTSFRMPEELIACALPLLAVIPRLPTEDIARRRRHYRLRVLAGGTLALLAGLGGGFFYAWYLF